MAEQIFNCTVRYGLPQGLGGLVDVISCPTWAAASGLLQYAQVSVDRMRRVGKSGFTMRGMMTSIRSMFSDLL
mgnify:CR=1 FL=1